VIIVYLNFSVGMYITVMLPHSDSYLYWCLVYTCEGISAQRMYVTVTSPYPRDWSVIAKEQTHDQPVERPHEDIASPTKKFKYSLIDKTLHNKSYSKDLIPT